MGNDEKNEEVPLHQILSAIKDIQYGSVQITIQDARIIQIEKTEKIRIKDISQSRLK